MAETIFSKIINGEIPAHKVYEDDRTLAFLDIHPVQPGHTLVIPKTEVDHVWELSSEDYAALMNTAKKVAIRLQKIMGTKRVAVQVIGFDVPHAHIHLIPCNSTEEFRNIPDMEAEPDHDALAALAEKLTLME